MGHETDAVELFAALVEAPYRFDFYQTLRRLECLYADKPRWGRALRPVEEPVRLGQEPELTFAPAPLAGFVPPADGRPGRLNVRLLGLLGPNGPMPTFFTEYVRDRLRNAGDPTLSRFLDIFHHRFLELFYRAWAQGQPHVSYDRPGDDRFARYPGACIGLLPQAHRDRDAVPDRAKLYCSGTLMRQVRSADGLAGILRGFFNVPVRIQELVGHWLGLSVPERTYLGSSGTGLGSGAVLGGSVWDRQSKFRIHVGPLSYDQYESFLPGGRRLRQLVDWVRFYLCFELDWDVQLQLLEREVPSAQLGAGHRLGWTTWLGARRTAGDAEDLCLAAEAHVGAVGAAAL
ncbi:MAG: type VI secretion system baseplate subunit TssG [Steroidobacteraceae bacterium]